jgi:serine/threonine-protein kinase RsbW
MTDTVTLVIPARTRNVALTRMLAAAMAARADLPIDQLEDVRLAVDEAVSQLVADARDDADVTCSFRVSEAGLDIRVEASTASGQVPPRTTFSWTVLTALVDEVSATTDGDIVTLDLHVTRHVPVDV